MKWWSHRPERGGGGLEDLLGAVSLPGCEAGSAGAGRREKQAGKAH